MKSKKIIIMAVFAVIVFGGLAAYLTSGGNKSDKQTGSKLHINAKTPGEITKDPGSSLSKEVAVTGRILHVSADSYVIADQNTTTPAAIRLDFSKSNIDPKQYVFTPPSPTSPNSRPNIAAGTPPPIDTSDKAKKAVAGAKKPKQYASVTIKGTLTQKQPNTPIVLVVTSVQ